MKIWKGLRSALLASLLLLGVLGFVLWQNQALQVEEVQVSSDRLPEEFAGLRVVELADLHGRCFGEGNKRLLRAVQETQPDLICLNGDLFDTKTDLTMLTPLLRGLTAIAPTYYVTGNHEWQIAGLRQILEQMEALGVQVLGNEYRLLRRGDARIVVAGVHDPCGPYDMMTPEELVARIREKEGEDVYILMLAHRNDTLPLWSSLEVDLVLAGHCHGGVIRLPFLGGVFGTRRDLFPEYDAGLYTAGQTALYVSRGLGYSNVRLRLFNRPHLPVLVLGREEN